MSVKIGINGFGRIGRQVLRAVNLRHKGVLEVVAINDLTNTKTNAHLFKYDSSYGIYPGKVEASPDCIIVDGKSIKVFAEREPGKIPWGDLGVQIVVESTGFFTDAVKAGAHLQGSVKKVVISAPAKGEDITIVLGVNEGNYDPARHRVISNASCTTNCLAPTAKVLNDNFGIIRALMTTVHAYTNDQKILDQFHSDLRRARGAALSIIPTSTGAAKALGLCLPEVQGKMHGLSLRVPTPTVSVVDLVADLGKNVTPEEVNDAFRAAAAGPMKGILEVCDEELVSIDFKGNPASAIVDAPITMVTGGSMVKVMSWYDNEWGYSCRTCDLAVFIASKGL